MKILTICIISHERPQMLKRMMNSLKHLSKNKDLDIIVTDNSILKAKEIRSLFDKDLTSSFILHTKEGCNQHENYINGLEKSKSKYICFFHDDDFTSITNKELEQNIDILKDCTDNRLYYFDSISYSDYKPFFLHIPNKKIAKPYSKGSYPFTLPVFPSWVYKNNKDLRNAIDANFKDRPFGKYSDILIIESLLEKSSYLTNKLSGFYFHIQHDLSDSSKRNLKSRFGLCKHTLKKSRNRDKPKILIDFIICTFNSILKSHRIKNS